MEKKHCIYAWIFLWRERCSQLSSFPNPYHRLAMKMLILQAKWYIFAYTHIIINMLITFCINTEDGSTLLDTLAHDSTGHPWNSSGRGTVCQLFQMARNGLISIWMMTSSLDWLTLHSSCKKIMTLICSDSMFHSSTLLVHPGSF